MKNAISQEVIYDLADIRIMLRRVVIGDNSLITFHNIFRHSILFIGQIYLPWLKVGLMTNISYLMAYYYM